MITSIKGFLRGLVTVLVVGVMGASAGAGLLGLWMEMKQTPGLDPSVAADATARAEYADQDCWMLRLSETEVGCGAIVAGEAATEYSEPNLTASVVRTFIRSDPLIFHSCMTYPSQDGSLGETWLATDRGYVLASTGDVCFVVFDAKCEEK